mgnify:CR=1 FL=1
MQTQLENKNFIAIGIFGMLIVCLLIIGYALIPTSAQPANCATQDSGRSVEFWLILVVASIVAIFVAWERVTKARTANLKAKKAAARTPQRPQLPHPERGFVRQHNEQRWS